MVRAARIVALACASLLPRGSAHGQAPAVAPTALPIVSLRISAVRQPIYGFGGSQTYAGDSLADLSNREAVYKALFQDLKIDIFSTAKLRRLSRRAGEVRPRDARVR